VTSKTLPSVTPQLDWSEYENAGLGDAYADIPKCGGDYAKAISVCIGSMQCLRPIDKGVMCPSFRVTMDGNMSPGGRVRLLKAALNGELGSEAFQDEALAKAMDLCVSCKGCKRECDSNVDMATIRAEYLAQRMQSVPPSRRDKLFANLPKLLDTIPFIAALIKLRNQSTWLRTLGEQWLGISSHRALPVPTRAARPADCTLRPAENKTNVVLFVDSFTRHFNPDLIHKTIKVLEHFGCHVIVPAQQKLCCGRTYFSGGFFAQAKLEAQRMLQVLWPYVEKGMPVIGLEPSCLLMFRDEYKSLGLGEQAKGLAQQAFLLEEFIARELQSGRANQPLKPYRYDRQLQVHGHCHEKSVGAMKAMRKVLKAIPQIDFELLDTSCCGGAGSFAFEAEHETISRDMAEQRLIPLLSALPGAPVLSNGFSCTHQIEALLTATKPMHLAEFLYQHIE